MKRLSEVSSKMTYWLTTQTKEVFKDYSKGGPTTNSRYVFMEGKQSEENKHLVVAHLDTVQELNRLKEIIYVKDTNTLHARGLDDRIGCYLAAELRKTHGFDLLLTIDEEVGNTSAVDFCSDCKKGGIKNDKYDWIVEFDREGGDVVTYGHETDEWKEALKDYFPEIGEGSFSDISSMEYFKCCKVNVGTGAYKSHAKDSYIKLDLLSSMLGHFEKFNKAFNTTKFPMEKVVQSEWGSFLMQGDSESAKSISMIFPLNLTDDELFFAYDEEGAWEAQCAHDSGFIDDDTLNRILEREVICN